MPTEDEKGWAGQIATIINTMPNKETFWNYINYFNEAGTRLTAASAKALLAKAMIASLGHNAYNRYNSPDVAARRLNDAARHWEEMARRATGGGKIRRKKTKRRKSKKRKSKKRKSKRRRR